MAHFLRRKKSLAPEQKAETETSEELYTPGKAQDEAALDEALQELESLIGLQEVKEEFKQLLDFIRIGKLKADRGIEPQALNLHMVFSGNPGTGKTTVARLVGKCFKALGLISQGQVVETDRSGLVAEYIGQTAQKTQKKLEEAQGGILFIDEAYALAKGGAGDFGQEALELILKHMEDHRDKLVVIMAGYQNEMQDLLDTNPGLRSRFATHLHFANFSGKELLNILKKTLLKANHQLESEAEEKAATYLEYLAQTSDRYFGNAREVRNLFEDLLKEQSSRLAQMVADKPENSAPLKTEELQTIKLEDLRACYGFKYQEQEELKLEDALAALHDLIGLEEIKTEMERLARYLQVQMERQEQGLELEKPSLHAVFMGPPGTGKTTVARLLARIYKALGLIKKDALTEASRADLVAEYVGQTAVKTNKLIDKAMHGVLFIDEAYALNGSGSDFGQEAIATLLKRMEDERENLAVVVAGYPTEMKEFVESNPGLKSRFNRYFNFEAFNADDLKAIFLRMAQKSHYQLEEGGEMMLQNIIENALAQADQYFGNARWVRNFFDRCKIEQAQRLSETAYLKEVELQCLKSEDLEAAAASEWRDPKESKAKKIGY